MTLPNLKPTIYKLFFNETPKLPSRYLDPEGHPFYWLTGRFVNEEPDADDTDEYWLGNEFISVVPARADQTDIEAVKRSRRLYDSDREL